MLKIKLIIILTAYEQAFLVNIFAFFSFLDSIMENREESESESESEIKRKVQQKRHCNAYQSDLTLSSATKKCLTQLKVG